MFRKALTAIRKAAEKVAALLKGAGYSQEQKPPGSDGISSQPPGGRPSA